MSETSAKWLQDYTWLVGEGDPLGIVQDIESWPFYQMIYAQTRIRSEIWNT